MISTPAGSTTPKATNTAGFQGDLVQSVSKHRSINFERYRLRIAATRIRIEAQVAASLKSSEALVTKHQSDVERWLHDQQVKQNECAATLAHQRESDAQQQAERREAWAKQDQIWRERIAQQQKETQARLAEWEKSFSKEQ